MLLPQTEIHPFDEAVFHEGPVVEFRLVYRGKLPSAGENVTRAIDKHRIRQKLHPQLRELWRQHPLLKEKMELATDGKSSVDQIADRFVRGAKGNYRFVPLVREENFHVCALDVLFLRRDSPGNLIASGGDLDNRMKVLFDALTVPNDNAKAGLAEWPAPDEDPFFCLLQDDKLITEVKITTDRLLHPKEDDERLGDVHLILHVKTQPVDYRGAFELY
jgi:hypothetical protein